MKDRIECCKYCGGQSRINPFSSSRALADGTCNSCLHDMHYAAKENIQVIWTTPRKRKAA